MKIAQKPYLFIILLLLSLLFSCQETDKIQPDTLQEHADEHNHDIAYNLKLIGRGLAKMMHDEEVRSSIRAQAMKQFDGDYDILYKDIKNLKLQSGESFENYLISFIPASPQCAAALPEVFAGIPKLQVSVPVHCESWNTDEFIPRVALQPYGQNELEITQIEAYNTEGYQSFIDAQEDPDFPVVVVGINERTDEFGNLRPEFQSETSKPSSPSNKRVSGDTEILDWIQIPKLNGVEGWADGKPEITVIVVGGRGSGNSGTANVQEITKKVLSKPSRKDIKNGKTFDLDLFDWKTEPLSSSTTTTADEIKLKFIEIDDSGNEWNFSLSAGGTLSIKEPVTGSTIGRSVTGTVGFKYKSKDDDCGDAIVDFSHPKPGPSPKNQYQTGTVNFKMN